MAISSSKIVSIFIVLSLLSLDLVHAGMGSGSSMAPGQDHKSPAPTPLPPPALDCDAACGVRCSLSSRPNLCKRACGTCCFRCHCVPSGTAGHYEECPCYASQTTHGGVRKCP
ncbi:gibberellin-regulated protein 11-like [Nymphaea colorata]|nr:gibberellin-regulated protein 11-like [Nymphaea colorata]